VFKQLTTKQGGMVRFARQDHLFMEFLEYPFDLVDTGGKLPSQWLDWSPAQREEGPGGGDGGGALGNIPMKSPFGDRRLADLGGGVWGISTNHSTPNGGTSLSSMRSSSTNSTSSTSSITSSITTSTTTTSITRNSTLDEHRRRLRRISSGETPLPAQRAAQNMLARAWNDFLTNNLPESLGRGGTGPGEKGKMGGSGDTIVLNTVRNRHMYIFRTTSTSSLIADRDDSNDSAQ
jgi:hypothetical protein